MRVIDFTFLQENIIFRRQCVGFYSDNCRAGTPLPDKFFVRRKNKVALFVPKNCALYLEGARGLYAWNLVWLQSVRWLSCSFYMCNFFIWKNREKVFNVYILQDVEPREWQSGHLGWRTHVSTSIFSTEKIDLWFLLLLFFELFKISCN